MAQKTLISIISQVAAELSFPQPSTVLSSQDQNIQKLVALCKAVCDDLLVEYDWQILQKRYTFNTVSGQDTYPFPVDLDRYISGSFFDANNMWPMVGPRTPVEWEWLKSANTVSPPYTQYRIFGNALVIAPVPSTTPYTFNMEYISGYYVRSGTGMTKGDFTVDDDICMFDHRVVIYGVRLKMREAMGLDSTAAYGDYKRALEQAKGQDTPSRTLSLSGDRGFRQISTDNYPDGSWK